MQWSEGNTNIVSVGQDARLLVWDAYTTNKMYTCAAPHVMSCGFSAREFIAFGGLDGSVNIHNFQKRSSVTTLNAHTGFISGCQFLNDKQMLTSSGDKSCKLWDIEHGNRVTEFLDHTADVMSIAIHPTDKNVFLSGSVDTKAKLWDIRTGKCTQTLEGNQADVNCVAFFPNGNAFGTASEDGSCRLFDVRADRDLMVYSMEAKAALSVGFSASGRLLFAGYDDNLCRVWDTLRGEVVSTLKGHSDKVACMGVTSNGMALCTGSWDSTLIVCA